MTPRKKKDSVTKTNTLYINYDSKGKLSYSPPGTKKVLNADLANVEQVKKLIIKKTSPHKPMKMTTRTSELRKVKK